MMVEKFRTQEPQIKAVGGHNVRGAGASGGGRGHEEAQGGELLHFP